MILSIPKNKIEETAAAAADAVNCTAIRQKLVPLNRVQVVETPLRQKRGAFLF